MMTTLLPEISRRQFLVAGGLTVAAAYFGPRNLFAEAGGLVEHALKESASAKITVQTLRRNISVLLGPGGNIAVLTGPDGKLLVDAEIVTAGPNVAAALTSINADPIKQLINTHWHFDHTGGNASVHQRWSEYPGPREHAQASFGRHACGGLAVHIPGHACRGDSFYRLQRGLHSARQWEDFGSKALFAGAHRLRHFRAFTARRSFFMQGTLFGIVITRSIDYSTGGSIDGHHSRSRSKPRESNRQDDRHSWARRRRWESRPDALP